MNQPITQTAADGALNGLLQWGVGGVILAVFVAPTFLILVRGAQKREEERARRDEDERRERNERERRLVDALVASVDQQKAALEEWRRFEGTEEKTHAALLQGIAQIGATLASISERMRVEEQASARTAQAQDMIAQQLERVANLLAKS